MVELALLVMVMELLLGILVMRVRERDLKKIE